MNRPGAMRSVKRAIVRSALMLPRARGARCLAYHSVTSTEERDAAQMTVSAERFSDQMRYLAEHGYRVTDAASAVTALRSGHALDPRTVVITFDDGFRDVASHALPVLEHFGFHATIFLVAAALEGDVAAMRNGYDGPYLSAAEARDMARSGHIGFGSHGATHQRLRRLDAPTLRDETEGAKARLERTIGTAVELYAYPFGSYDAWDRTARDAVEVAGYRGAFTSIVAPLRPTDDVFLLPRARVSWTEDDAGFAALLNGGYDWYARWQRLQTVRS